MAYKALYRSYRPKTFTEVIGQKHVIQTLKNALKENRTSHAYVFSGLRGIGKTTIARILAKAVNCLDLKDGEPCGVCNNCKAIDNNETADIVELDAASNNGVDEMRNILEKVNFLPSLLKKKVYIIDEVHMLSGSAFNALLKTLEEPPAYVMFILATTEPHKIPLTILSRCQRFDFKQLSNNEIIQELQIVCEKEQIKATGESLDSIATASDGGMRDALSILDQASVYANDEITVEDVNSITGRVSTPKLINLVCALNESDATLATDICNDLLNMGKEVSRLITSLIEFCRDILLFKSVSGIEKEKNLYSNEDFISLCNTSQSERIFYYIDNFVDIQNKIRFTSSQKIYLEVGIMKIVNCASNEIDLNNRMKKLEEILSDGGISLDNYSESNSSINEQKLSILENKVKKISGDLEKANINGFMEKMNSRINIIEEETSKVSILPTSLETRIQTLENILISPLDDSLNIDTLPSDKVDNSISCEDLDSRINLVISPIEKQYNSLVEQINDLKSTVSEKILASNDDVICELIEKLEELESKVISLSSMKDVSSDPSSEATYALDNSIQVVTIEEASALLLPLQNQLDSLNSQVNELKAQLCSSSYSELPDNSDLSEVKESINALSMKFNELKKNAPSLYNKEIQDDIPANKLEASTIQELKERINSVETKLNSIDIDNILSSVKDVSTNYFVLAEAFKYVKEKCDTLNVTNVGSEDAGFADIALKLNALETNYSKLFEKISEIEEIKEMIAIKINELKDEIPSIVKPIIVDEINSNKKVLVNSSVVNTDNDNKLNEIKETKVDKEDTTTIQTTQSAESVQTPLNDNQQEEKRDLTKEVYDVKIVEKVLHESRTTECREQKELLLRDWNKIEDKVGGLLAGIAGTLANGLLMANGVDTLLIVYKTAQQCNILMEPKAHQDAKEILKLTFRKDYDFICLPDVTWKEKRLEYINRFHMGEKYPKLTPIVNSELKVFASSSPKVLSDKENLLKKADEFFGRNK